MICDNCKYRTTCECVPYTEECDNNRDTFERLLPLVEPFGDAETIAELILLYTEVIPNILVGDYDNVLEGLSEEAEEMARVAIKHRRKDMFAKLLEKYND